LRDNKLEQGGKEIALSTAPAEIPGEWRLYARAASDDKAPIEAMLVALDALRAAGTRPTINLKFFFEGEEEASSPHLPDATQKYGDLLRADAWLFCDGPVHPTRRMQVYFGARGVMGLEMTVYGATRSLHSGHYGNWAPNPAVLVAELLASMRDQNARIKIAGYYDDVRPLTAAEKQAIAAMPEVDEQMRRELALAWTEGQPEPLTMRLTAPGLNVRGIEAGHVGDKAQNAIPTEARASIDFRLVPQQKPDRVRQLVEEHIRRQGFYIIHQATTPEERLAHARIARLQWESGYPASRTPMELPVSRAVVATIEETLGVSIVKMPMLGGSIPMYLFNDVLHTPVIGLPIVNHDNNQHAANENLRMQNLWDGISVFAGLMSGLEAKWVY
jgi:acetylornithine deacetylase/succinyl-diaminopimelate desuccinylase-like protein